MFVGSGGKTPSPTFPVVYYSLFIYSLLEGLVQRYNKSTQQLHGLETQKCFHLAAEAQQMWHQANPCKEGIIYPRHHNTESVSLVLTYLCPEGEGKNCMAPEVMGRLIWK